MSSSFEPGEAASQDDWGSSSSSLSSSADSSPPPPLPDSVLRSFQFPSQQRANAMNSNAFPAHPRSASNTVRVSRSTGTDDPSAASTANGETHAEARDGMKLSRLSNRELDLVIAKLEARVSERRNKIRKIEALSEELGLSIRQQDWLALLNRPSPETGQSIAIGERDRDHERAQAESAAPPNIEPVPISETIPTPDSAVTDDGSANSFSNVQAEPEIPRRSQRLLRSHKRSHGQLARYADGHEGGEDEEIPEVNHQRSEVDENEGFSQSNSSLVFVDGVAKRTAWSVVLEKHPEEIAAEFRAGERPTNKRVNSMLDLPAVNALLNNPMRNKRTLGWHIRDDSSSRQTQKLVSILIQITGVAAVESCEKCEKGCGLWTGCYLRPADATGVRNVACANCMYNNKGSTCRWKQGPALP